MSEKKDNSGVLFKNDKREKDTHPQAKGSCMIDGVEYWIAAWRKTSQSGTEFTSLSFTRKDNQPASVPKAEPTLEAPVFPDRRTTLLMWQKEDFTDSATAYMFISELMQAGYRTVSDREPILRPGFAGVSWGETSEGKLLFYTNSRNCFSSYDGATKKQKQAAREAAQHERIETRKRHAKQFGLPGMTNNAGLSCPIQTIHWPKNAKYAALDQYGNLIFFQGKRPTYHHESGWKGDSISGKQTAWIGSEKHLWRKRLKKS